MAGGREFFAAQQCLPVLKPEKQIRNMAIIYGECLNALEIKYREFWISKGMRLD